MSVVLKTERHLTIKLKKHIRMKKSLTLMLFIFICAGISMAQVGINNDASAPDSSAILDVKSDTRGLLPPRMTTLERDAITNPVEGLVVYNTDSKIIELYNGAGWVTSTGETIPAITQPAIQIKDTAAIEEQVSLKFEKGAPPPE